MQQTTLHAKLLAECMDSMGYTNYVFEDIETQEPDFKYIMCVKFPNWNQNTIEIGDVGYLNIRFVEEGVDKWFNGTDFIPYKYTNIIFLKFIKKEDNIDLKDITLD